MAYFDETTQVRPLIMFVLGDVIVEAEALLIIPGSCKENRRPRIEYSDPNIKSLNQDTSHFPWSVFGSFKIGQQN